MVQRLICGASGTRFLFCILLLYLLALLLVSFLRAGFCVLMYSHCICWLCVRCIFLELLTKKPAFPGHDEKEECELIFKACRCILHSLLFYLFLFTYLSLSLILIFLLIIRCVVRRRRSPGTAAPCCPTTNSLSLRHTNAACVNNTKSTLHRSPCVVVLFYSRVFCGSISPSAFALLDRLLQVNPQQRISAKEALDHDYFWSGAKPEAPLYDAFFLLCFAFAFQHICVVCVAVFVGSSCVLFF